MLLLMMVSAVAWASDGLTPRVHFLSNQEDLTTDQLHVLNENAAWLEQNRAEVIILEGHCDEWGEHWYNLELGDRRARTVKAYLIEKGIDPERIILVVSYGDKRPLNPEHNNEAWKQNRRVEFVLR